MNLCTLYNTTECVRENRTPKQPRRPGVSTCAACPAYVDSGVARVPLTVKATAPQPQPVPRAEWPLLARVVAHLRNDTDVGIGDTIARSLGTAGEFYKHAYKSLTGKSCGCTDRQKYLNQLYAY